MRALVRVNVVVVALAHGCSPPRLPSCLEIETGRWDDAFAQCSLEYIASRDPAIGREAARAAYFRADNDEAARIASELVLGPQVADASYVLGSVALVRGELDEAREHLERALSIHTQQGKLREQTRDAFQLAGAWLKLGEYGRSLDALEVLRATARRTSEHRMLVFAHLGSASIHRAIGDLDRAEEEAELAAANAQHPDDLLDAQFRKGLLQLDVGHHERARASFERVLADGDPASVRHAKLMDAAHLNLVYIDLKAGRPEDALQRLEAHRGEHGEVMYRLLRGLVRADMGKLAEARADLRLAEAARPRGELSWRVPYHAALVETAAGRIDAAVAASERAIAKVTDLAARSGTYGSEVIATHRQPHFHLIGLHAARRDWDKVLGVVATLDAHALIDSRAAPAELAPSVGAPLVLPAPPRAELGDPDAVVDAWRGRLLVIAVPGGDRAWRLVLRDGALDGRDLGDLGRLEALAQQLADHPDDAVAGRALGEALLGGLPADRPIDLLAIGPLAGAAVASLHLGDRLAISRLRIARVPGVLPRIARGGAAAGAPGAAGAQRAVVLGDPHGDLPASAEEAARLAVRLGARARIGGAAT
ncbi:MAG TPA: tetratricopeptide repeat protein, partial [Kofleriaceae bacterium]|nr:tetratricopeptide repeat protein [Kofleriaceae bacterium]